MLSKNSIQDSLPYLEAELSLFPNVKVIMLMGDVAKKAFNMITKKATKKMLFLLFPPINCVLPKFIIKVLE